uniref:RRM domain-containing protein n=12 Tax=Aegilops tauschii subsp. strangulata TaxID=200361 RepID=A0A453D9H5_AEGTS
RQHHHPPPPPVEPEEEEDVEDAEGDFRQKGKVFVGNLPLRARKAEVAYFFRQFGPLDKVEFVRTHDDPERNAGFCFLYYADADADAEGQGAEAAAERAAEVDGVDFRGRSLTVRLDDGRKGRARAEDRARWVDHGRGKEAPSPWHHGRDEACREFRRVVESRPEDWQAVVSAFERIPKPSRREFGLMIVYYAKRGDKHHARATFENMRARGIDPNAFVFTR